MDPFQRWPGLETVRTATAARTPRWCRHGMKALYLSVKIVRDSDATADGWWATQRLLQIGTTNPRWYASTADVSEIREVLGTTRGTE